MCMYEYITIGDKTIIFYCDFSLVHNFFYVNTKQSNVNILQRRINYIIFYFLLPEIIKNLNCVK